jgi:HK97 family phage prohead protease
MKRQLIQAVIKKVDEAKATLDAVFSTSDEDRHGDIVEQNWDLKSYKKNPVLLNSHQSGDATEVIGKVKPIKVEDGKLQGKVHFAVNENPKAKVIFDLYSAGFLNAFSVGFIPKEFDEKNPFKILKSELLEISSVPVGANDRALAKQKGIDIDKLSDTEKNEPTSDAGIENQAPASDAGIENTSSEKAVAFANDIKVTRPEPKKEQKITPEQKAIMAVSRIQSERKRKIKVINRIIDELRDLKESGVSDNQKKFEKKKLNQAIRNLIEEKKR